MGTHGKQKQLTCQLFTSLEAVVDIIMNMEIGLLDFQSRGGQNTNFPTHPHHGVPLNHLDFTNFNAGHLVILIKLRPKTRALPRVVPNSMVSLLGIWMS